MSTYTERQLSKLLDEHVKDLKSLADGWQAGSVKFAHNQAYARGLGVCAKQLCETIARLETMIADEREADDDAEPIPTAPGATARERRPVCFYWSHPAECNCCDQEASQDA